MAVISTQYATIRNPQLEGPQSVQWLTGGTVRLIDQTLLPLRLEYVDCGTVEKLADCIRTLKVRGAPAIGVAAAYGLCLAARNSLAPDVAALLADLHAAAETLRATRPTAVNLSWALDEVLRAAEQEAAHSGEYQEVRDIVLATARRIDRDNQEANLRMGLAGAKLLRDGMNVLTHCNTGPLAAGGIGSALGVIYMAHGQGKRLHVWVDETRPFVAGRAPDHLGAAAVGRALHAHSGQYGGLADGGGQGGRCAGGGGPHRGQWRHCQ